jgi:transketolase C-terminal domain/subunit
MWNEQRFPSKAKVIDCGLGESNLVNLAAGIASVGHTVFIYGVAGFIIHRYEQLKFGARNFGSKFGKIIICNAGKVGYEKFGLGHRLDDDISLMETLKIPTYEPEDEYEFNNILKQIRNEKNGIWYIRLGRDVC